MMVVMADRINIFGLVLGHEPRAQMDCRRTLALLCTRTACNGLDSTQVPRVRSYLSCHLSQHPDPQGSAFRRLLTSWLECFLVRKKCPGNTRVLVRRPVVAEQVTAASATGGGIVIHRRHLRGSIQLRIAPRPSAGDEPRAAGTRVMARSPDRLRRPPHHRRTC